jgi:hypothetical protein
MHKTKLATSLLLLFVLLAIVVPARGQPSNFTIENADDSNILSVAASSELNTLIANVEPRFVVQHANANLYYAFGSMPSELLNLIGEVNDRCVIQYANENKYYSVTYPLELINDTTPPKISDVAAKTESSGDETITWNTDEFTTSTVEYGSQPGTYSQSVTDELFNKQHEIVLSGLTVGESYYYRITDTDRSGNSTRSSEYSFTVTVTSYVYLPAIMR